MYTPSSYGSNSTTFFAAVSANCRSRFIKQALKTDLQITASGFIGIFLINSIASVICPARQKRSIIHP
ncbi:hypothetical protein HanPI659440_Chr16g0635711 [Helianthus annuus]|nr:hypothetical protein HanPI659440_Chr16g0635711 [Helianthus annuus]